MCLRALQRACEVLACNRDKVSFACFSRVLEGGGLGRVGASCVHDHNTRCKAYEGQGEQPQRSNRPWSFLLLCQQVRHCVCVHPLQKGGAIPPVGAVYGPGLVVGQNVVFSQADKSTIPGVRRNGSSGLPNAAESSRSSDCFLHPLFARQHLTLFGLASLLFNWAAIWGRFFSSCKVCDLAAFQALVRNHADAPS